MAEVLRTAAALGAMGVRADTTVGSRAAQSVLRRLGFDLALSSDGAGVEAVLMFADAAGVGPAATTVCTGSDELMPVQGRPTAAQALMGLAGDSTGADRGRVR